MPAKQAIKCAFCDNDASEMRSGEHICSAWIERLFGPQEYNWTHTDRKTGTNRSWKKKGADEKIRDVVCSECNNGWMSNLENLEAKPALTNIIRDGAPQCLLPRGILSLSLFAFKHTVVANHSNPNREPFFTRAARERFKNSLQIPPGVQMWIGAFQSVYANSGIFTSHHLEADPEGRSLDDFELYIFTFAVGHLVFQVLASKWTKVTRRRLPLPVLRPNTFWNSAAIQFWPMDGHSIEWPPTHYLNENMLKKFA
jgi:hypothetical protein